MPTSILKGQIVDVHLTGLAQGFKAGNTIADQLLPVLKTPVLEGKYIKWDTNAFKVPSTLRGYGAQTKRTDYDYQTGTFTLPAGYTGEIWVDRRVAQQQKTISNLNMAKQKLALKQGDMAREKELKAATLVTTVGNWASGAFGNVSNSGTGGWGTAATDIFGDIENAKKSIQSNFGTRDNLVLVLTYDVWVAMRKNTGLKSYFINTEVGAAAFNQKQIADLFGIEDVLIADATYTNAAGTSVNVWGNQLAAILHRAPAPAGPGPVDPSNLPPSWGWTMQLDAHPFVDSYYDASRTSDIYQVHDNYLHVQTSPIGGYLFQSVLT